MEDLNQNLAFLCKKEEENFVITQNKSVSSVLREFAWNQRISDLLSYIFSKLGKLPVIWEASNKQGPVQGWGEGGELPSCFKHKF